MIDSVVKCDASQSEWKSCQGSDEESCTESAGSRAGSKRFLQAVSGLGMQCSVKNSFLAFGDPEDEDENVQPKGIKKNTRSASQPSQPKMAGPSSGCYAASPRSDVTSGCESGGTSGSGSVRTKQGSGRSNNGGLAMALAGICPNDLDALTSGTGSDFLSTSESDSCDNLDSRISNSGFNQLTVHQQSFPEEAQDDTPPVPVEAMAELHAAGRCKPCLYQNSKAGCMSGARCRFCHEAHAKKNRSRPCRAKRVQRQQMLTMLNVIFTPESPEFQDFSERLSSESTYARSLLQKVNARPGSAGSSDAGSMEAQGSSSSAGSAAQPT